MGGAHSHISPPDCWMTIYQTSADKTHKTETWHGTYDPPNLFTAELMKDTNATPPRHRLHWCICLAVDGKLATAQEE